MSELDNLIDDYIMSDKNDLNVMYAASKRIAGEYRSLVRKLGNGKANEIVMRIINEVDVSEIMEEDHEAVPDLQKFEQLWIR